MSTPYELEREEGGGEREGGGSLYTSCCPTSKTLTMTPTILSFTLDKRQGKGSLCLCPMNWKPGKRSLQEKTTWYD